MLCRNLNPAIVSAVVEALVVLAHGEFLHPDAASLAGFLNHGRQDTKKLHMPGGEPPPPQPSGDTPPAPSSSPSLVDIQGSDSVSLSSAGGTAAGSAKHGSGGEGGGPGGDGGRGAVGEPAAAAPEGCAEAGGSAGGEAVVVLPPRRGDKGTCMVSGLVRTTKLQEYYVAALRRGGKGPCMVSGSVRTKNGESSLWNRMRCVSTGLVPELQSSCNTAGTSVDTRRTA